MKLLGARLDLRLPVFHQHPEFEVTALVLLPDGGLVLCKGSGNRLFADVGGGNITQPAGLGVFAVDLIHLGLGSGRRRLRPGSQVPLHLEAIPGIFPLIDQSVDAVPVLPVTDQAGFEGIVAEQQHGIGNGRRVIASRQAFHLFQEFQGFPLFQADEILFILDDQLLQAPLQKFNILNDPHAAPFPQQKQVVFIRVSGWNTSAHRLSFRMSPSQ